MMRNLFVPPSPKELAERQLRAAQLALLEAQQARENYDHMVRTLADRIKRLTYYLDAQK